MTVRDSMRRHPAGKALPHVQARLVGHAARESALEAVAGLTGAVVCLVFVVGGVLVPGLDWPLRLLLVAPLPLVPALLRQGVHGATDALRLAAWARHYRNQRRTK